MKSIVENAGTPEGLALMNKATVREEAVENIGTANGNVGAENLVEPAPEPSNLQKNIVEGQQRIIDTGKKTMHVAQSGGSLYQFLLQISHELAPAAALGAAALYRRTRKRVSRKGKSRKTRGRK